MEVSQAIWLPLFFFGALLISPKRFDEIILDFYQDAGIWIVIASCVAEYLLLLTYIGVAAYDFFKNRKMMKKMNVQRRTYEFLKFDESHRDVGNRWREPGSTPQAIAGFGPFVVLPLAALGQYRQPQVKHEYGKYRSRIFAATRAKKSVTDNAPNNPQLLQQAGRYLSVLRSSGMTSSPSTGSRRMNKSLKRKQIE